MNKPSLKDFKPLDLEETVMMKSHEQNDYHPVDDKVLKKMQKVLMSAARNTQRQHISIKVPQDDLTLLKAEADQNGLRYQSLINSILHQYVTGRLKSVAH